MLPRSDRKPQTHSGEPHFELHPVGPYSLGASIRFLEGFTPAARESSDQSEFLHLAFVPDGMREAVGVCVRQEGETIVGEVFGDAPVTKIQGEVARILSLDVDGTAFPAVGERDRVVGRLQARYPGLRPVCFYTPYEAAAWAMIGNRIRITQAAKIKARLSEEHGTRFAFHDDVQYAFPSPARLAEVEAFDGLTDRKIAYLHGLAPAAAVGVLDAATLRSLPTEEAIAQLKTIKGIGDFGAELILLRGAGEPDHYPGNEPRLARAVQRAYELRDVPSAQELEQIAEGWRPFRTWVTLLLRVMLEAETHEIAGPRRSA